MFNFFIDTADASYINTLNLKPFKENCLGITTNPNAMSKINCYSLASWVKVLPSLCELVSNIRGDSEGQVHVQAPNSKMSGDEVLAFVRYIHDNTDGNTSLALKIPPTISVLRKVQQIKQYMPVNVTGLSDCCSALACMTYGVDYVSIIPGRMEEVGIDANAHLEFLTKSALPTRVITGSMRTIEGLVDAVKRHTIPTIGTRVWDKLGGEFNFSVDQMFDRDSVQPFAPFNDEANLRLSVDFFAQMDELGLEAYTNFQTGTAK